MNRSQVRSSNIKSVGYDAVLQLLEIEFHSGGIYQYKNVSQAVYESFISAVSKGSFFDQKIKDRYAATKMR